MLAPAQGDSLCSVRACVSNQLHELDKSKSPKESSSQSNGLLPANPSLMLARPLVEPLMAVSGNLIEPASEILPEAVRCPIVICLSPNKESNTSFDACF